MGSFLKMRKTISCLTLILILSCFTQKSRTAYVPSLRPRAFSLFNIVSFPNQECTTKSTNEPKGTCVTPDECNSQGGTSSANCASGFGVCCYFTLTACGGTVSKNLTYVQNPSYPSTESGSTAMSCAYTINALASAPAVVQVRLDFDVFIVRQPETTGSCDDDTITFTTPTGNGMALPTLCGTLSDQHIYIETGLESTAATFTIKTNTDTGTNRQWNIKVSQIPGHTKWTAIPDCLQYHTGHSGTFRAFNHPTGTLIQAQLYQICIRQEEGSCSIAYSVRQVDSSVDAFDMDGTAAKRNRGCDTTHLQIRQDRNTGDIYCGGSFSNVSGDRRDGVVYSHRAPFVVYVYAKDDDQTSDRGFSLQYMQLPCGHRYTAL